MTLGKCRSLLLTDRTLQISPAVVAVACCEEHTGAEQLLLVHFGVLGAYRGCKVEPFLLKQTVLCAYSALIEALCTCVPSEVGCNVVLLGKSLVKHQHGITVDDVVLIVGQAVRVRVVTVGRERVSLLCAVLVLGLVGCEVRCHTCAQLQSRDDIPSRVDRTDEAVVLLFLCLAEDVPEIFANQCCRAVWRVE